MLRFFIDQKMSSIRCSLRSSKLFNRFSRNTSKVLNRAAHNYCLDRKFLSPFFRHLFIFETLDVNKKQSLHQVEIFYTKKKSPLCGSKAFAHLLLKERKFAESFFQSHFDLHNNGLKPSRFIWNRNEPFITSRPRINLLSPVSWTCNEVKFVPINLINIPNFLYRLENIWYKYLMRLRRFK